MDRNHEMTHIKTDLKGLAFSIFQVILPTDDKNGEYRRPD